MTPLPLPGVELAPGYGIPGFIVGGWQLSEGHGSSPREAESVVETLVALADRGLTAFDCADIYTGVEELYGRFLARWRTVSTGGNPDGDAGSPIRIHTKFVPDHSHLPQVDEGYVRRVVERSLRRLGVETLDLVQFYWWDLSRGDWLRAARALVRLQEEGKIRHLGATNFSASELESLRREAGMKVLTNQVQYSPLDRRPEHGLVTHALQEGVHLLAYGALAGGFLSRRWLGRDDPGLHLPNRSLVKYRLIVQEFGGWEAFQRLLGELEAVGRAHGATAAQVALRFVLDQPAVAAAMVGFTSLVRMEENLGALTLELSADDHARIRRITGDAPGPGGEIFGLERDRSGPHGRIMRYEENG